MKQLTGNEIRQLYLEFFIEKGHQVEPSAPLVPINDPSLLWINSGVATLKKYFDGRVIPQNPRITNAQKSIRTNDIENVGKTARHHTFFEMLGNFSIGDYFKKEAIHFAWEFLTDKKWMGFDPELLSVTVHPEDEEAYTIWKEEVGIPESRIIRLEGNFWDIGEGPSGPNSEIFYDRGEKYGNDLNDPELYPGGENERYLEIWNLVFSQFNHNPDHTYTPLPKQNIDTGMGLERMASVVQDVPTNFDTDLFMPIIEQTQQISGQKYGESKDKDVAFKVIADHIRTVAFAIGDGALPSNEGRGYVLRRLLRRAVRFAKQLGVEKPFLFELVPVVGELMEVFYPEVKQKEAFIMRVIKTEEERFHETLADGLSILSRAVEEQKAQGSTVVPGTTVFTLYDTYGFPVELTEEFAEEANMTIDRQGFDSAMDGQRTRARAARQNVDSMQVQSEVFASIQDDSEFMGYDQLKTVGKVTTLIIGAVKVETATEGDEVKIVLDRTPFYAESGGQIADIGTVSNDHFSGRVKDVQKAPNGQNLHSVVIESGELHVGMDVTAQVDAELRSKTIKNHSATHLLHQALKDILGTHVNQAGSYVGPDRLRFDFSHFGQATKEELEQVERIVNEKIWASTPVVTGFHSIDEAKQRGAMALFGEKYGDIVRVVEMGDYSLELCGGCHVSTTAEIGVFKIVSEGGIGAGTRRIEAVTGQSAYELMKEEEARLAQAASLLKAQPREIVAKTEALLAELKQLQKENTSLSAKLSSNQAGDLVAAAHDVNGISVLTAKVEAQDNNQLRQLVDDLKQKLGSGVVVLGAVAGEKVMIAAGVTKDLAGERAHAGNLAKHVAEQCGGKGGGRPDFAMAGAKDGSKLEEALKSVDELVK